MLILTIRSDKPIAEIGLYSGLKRLDYIEWAADRQLAETIHLKIKQLLDGQKLSLNDLGGIAVYKGPGSFTGLRIGLSVANALADGLAIPIVGAEGSSWLEKGCQALVRGHKNDKIVLPKYGAPPHVTKPKS